MFDRVYIVLLIFEESTLHVFVSDRLVLERLIRFSVINNKRVFVRSLLNISSLRISVFYADSMRSTMDSFMIFLIKTTGDNYCL
jgi:hypothetical protein